jgi:GTPase SAR1 family protein
VFDLTARATFDSVERWVGDVREERGQNVFMVIVGNKLDKADERVVTQEEGEAKAKSLDALYVETSAKTGDNVQQLFHQIAMSLPGMENAQVPNGDLVDIKLHSSNSQ